MSTLANLEARISTLESGPPSEEVAQRIRALRDELIRNESLSVEVLGSLVQTQASLVAREASNVDTAVVMDAAPLPTEPLQLTAQNIVYALFVSLILGVATAFVLEYLDRTIRTPDKLEALYGMPALGVIGVIPGGDGRAARPEQIVALTRPRCPIAEAFRSLRTAIQFAGPNQPARSVLVTSAGPSEGKTLTAANLAVSLAGGGSRVILVDANLRQPRQHRLFEVPQAPGFTDLVNDPKGNLEDCLKPTTVENLRVLPSGTVPPNPAELLGSPRAAETMAQLTEHADVVVYDSPAVTVTDAVVMSSRVDAVLQVVWAGGTHRDLVRQGRAVLEKVGARILGPVLNRVSRSELRYCGTYQHGKEPESKE